MFLLLRALETDRGRLWSVIWRPRTFDLLTNTLLLVGSVTLASLVIGVATAWALARFVIPGHRIFVVLAALPLAIPSYVAAFGWRALDPSLKGFWPAWLVVTVVSCPLVTLPVMAALRRADHSLVETARSFGRSPARAWAAAMLPQLGPAAAAGGLLVALYTLSEFGAVTAMRYEVFTFAVMQSLSTLHGIFTVALGLALVLVILAVIVVALERFVRIRGERWRVGAGSPLPLPRINAGPFTPLLMAAMLVVPVLAFGVPVYALFTRFTPSERTPLVIGDLLSATGNTLMVAAVGALVAIIVCLPIGVLAARYRGPAVTVIETAGFTGHALPGVVVGLALIYFALRVAPSIYHTVALLVLAYAVMFLPKAIGATRTSIEQAPPALTDTARSLGRGPFAAWWLTTGRIATPGISAGALLVALTIMKELPATLFLRPAGFDTLATKLWNLMTNQAYGAAAPYALTLMVVAAVPALILSRPAGGQDS